MRVPGGAPDLNPVVIYDILAMAAGIPTATAGARARWAGSCAITKGLTAGIRIMVAACRKPRRVAGIIPQDAPRPAREIRRVKNFKRIITWHHLMSKAGPRDYNEAAKPVLKMMVERIVRNFNPARIILFGSYARGTPNFHSDIDLLVIMENGTKRRETAVKIRKLLRGSPIAKDVVVTTTGDIEKHGSVPVYAICNALREGVTLYER